MLLIIYTCFNVTKYVLRIITSYTTIRDIYFLTKACNSKPISVDASSVHKARNEIYIYITGFNHFMQCVCTLTSVLWRLGVMLCLGSLMKILKAKDTNSQLFFFQLLILLGVHVFMSLCLALREMEGPVEERLCGKMKIGCGLHRYNLRDVFTW